MVGLAGSAGGVEVSVKEVPNAFPGAKPLPVLHRPLAVYADRVPYHNMYTTDLHITSKYC